VVELVDTLA